MTIDLARRVQARYVLVSDGVRLAVDVWLPVERIARGERVGTAFRATRYTGPSYHRVRSPSRTATMLRASCGTAPDLRWSSSTRAAPGRRSARARWSSVRVRSP